MKRWEFLLFSINRNYVSWSWDSMTQFNSHLLRLRVKSFLGAQCNLGGVYFAFPPIFRRQRLMYSTRVCSLVNLRGGWVGRGLPPTPPPTPPTPTPPTPHPPPPRLPPPPTPPTHPQLASSSTDTFKQRENQNKEKLTKVAAYEL